MNKKEYIVEVFAKSGTFFITKKELLLLLNI